MYIVREQVWSFKFITLRFNLFLDIFQAYDKIIKSISEKSLYLRFQSAWCEVVGKCGSQYDDLWTGRRVKH